MTDNFYGFPASSNDSAVANLFDCQGTRAHYAPGYLYDNVIHICGELLRLNDLQYDKFYVDASDRLDESKMYSFIHRSNRYSTFGVQKELTIKDFLDFLIYGNDD